MFDPENGDCGSHLSCHMYLSVMVVAVTTFFGWCYLHSELYGNCVSSLSIMPSGAPVYMLANQCILFLVCLIESLVFHQLLSPGVFLLDMSLPLPGLHYGSVAADPEHGCSKF
jgi:hypothetical protein